MIPVRKTVEIAEGVRVDLLVTPHLAVYEEASLIKPITESASVGDVLFRYADLMYLAALNAWELDGHGTVEDFPHSRGDFHAFMQADSKGFSSAMSFIIHALTGKTSAELEAEEKERRKKAKDEKEQPEDGVKKKTFLSRIMHRSRSSS